jgi:hypothetical protein
MERETWKVFIEIRTDNDAALRWKSKVDTSRVSARVTWQNPPDEFGFSCVVDGPSHFRDSAVLAREVLLALEVYPHRPNKTGVGSVHEVIYQGIRHLNTQLKYRKRGLSIEPHVWEFGGNQWIRITIA